MSDLPLREGIVGSPWHLPLKTFIIRIHTATGASLSEGGLRSNLRLRGGRHRGIAFGHS